MCVKRYSTAAHCAPYHEKYLNPNPTRALSSPMVRPLLLFMVHQFFGGTSTVPHADSEDTIPKHIIRGSLGKL